MERRKSSLVVMIFVALTVAAIVLVVLLKNMMNGNDGEELDVSRYTDRGITKAYRIPEQDGETEAYEVFVTVPGYKSDIETKIRIEEDGEKLLDLQILSQAETAELGGKITEDSFLNQFRGKELPITLRGKENAESEEPGQTNNDLGEAMQRTDGVYRAEGEEFGGNLSQVTMVIENGEITELHWDSFDAEGNGKRALSLQGKYTMTEDGLLWADQADAVQNYVLEHQGLSGLTTNEEGKTDVVSGVSISIASFKELVKDCLTQATVGGADGTASGNTNSGNNVNSGSEGNTTGNVAAGKVDGVSGATISSTAVVQAVQTAYEFVLDQGR